MQQFDPDDRLLAALRGERVTPDDPIEASELRAAARIGAAARRDRYEDDEEPLAPLELPRPEARTLPSIADEVSQSSSGLADAIPLERKRRFRTWIPSVAAAAIAVIAGTALLLNGDRSEQIAFVDLDPLIDEGAATAELVDRGDRFELRVAVEGVAPEGEYLELWLINSEISQLVSFGPIEDGGTYTLPEGLDPADFPVVDVSVESFDGDPTHSGQSVFRGEFSL